jgi:NADH-quinone oxidoreductase subunit F
MRILFRHLDNPDIDKIDVYCSLGGYKALEKAVKEMSPDDVIGVVKESGIQGRGGAGFPAGLKWSFVPKDFPGPRYLVANADESEPGTFKDREIMERNPHQVIEGIAIASYAIGCHKAFIYIRGEFAHPAECLEKAIADACDRGYLGEDIFGTDFSLDIVVHRGAGAYICGEETALLDSLEGRRGHPRLKPPFPASKGLYGCPTVINNVETLANVPFIISEGAQAFRAVGTEKSPGTKIFCVSGDVAKPGNYELPMGTTLRELIFEHAGGIPDGRKIKAIIPGGSSVPMITADKLDAPLSFEGMQEAGTMLGCAAVIVIDESVCIVKATLRISEFYMEESCGKCTPCREGTSWIVKLLERIEEGKGKESDLDLLLDICDNIAFKSFCPLGDAAVPCVQSSIALFRDEYLHHIREHTCMVGQQAALA